MATTLGCGCKICKAELGEFTNECITLGDSPIQTLEKLQKKGLKTTEKLLKKHLAAYSIPYPETPINEVIDCEPVTVDLNKIDFSEYNFDSNNIESIIGYLQKINLKIYLNQTRITLQAQQDVIDGKSPDMPREIMQNLALAYQILDKSLGMNVIVNQQQAVKICESIGLLKPQTLDINAEDSTDTKTN